MVKKLSAYQGYLSSFESKTDTVFVKDNTCGCKIYIDWKDQSTVLIFKHAETLKNLSCLIYCMSLLIQGLCTEVIGILIAIKMC